MNEEQDEREKKVSAFERTVMDDTKTFMAGQMGRAEAAGLGAGDAMAVVMACMGYGIGILHGGAMSMMPPEVDRDASLTNLVSAIEGSVRHAASLAGGVSDDEEDKTDN